MLEQRAQKKNRGTLWIEFPPAKTDQGTDEQLKHSQIPKNKCVRISLFAEIPPLTIAWTDQSGETPPKDPYTPLKTHNDECKKQTWRHTQGKALKGPKEDGRWDAHRSIQTANLNQHTIKVFIYHHHEDEIDITHYSIRRLADILSRISAPLYPLHHPNKHIPFLRWNNANASLAIRHFPTYTQENQNPLSRLNEADHQSFVYTPPNKLCQILPYGPLRDPAKEAEHYPTPCIPQYLAEYCKAKGSVFPDEDAISITAALLHIEADLESVRYNMMAHLAFLIGSPTNHLKSTHTPMQPLTPCEICNHLTTSLRAITVIPVPQYNPNNKPLITLSETGKLFVRRKDHLLSQNITTHGDSARAKRARTDQIEFIATHPIYICYICALPTIVQTRRYYFEEAGEDTDLLHNDVKAHAHESLPIALPFVHKKPITRLSPWGSDDDRNLIGNLVNMQEDVQGIIVEYAPLSTTPYPLVYFIQPQHETLENDEPENEIPNLEHCEEWDPIQTRKNLIRIGNPDAPIDNFTPWMGFNLETWPPGNLQDMKAHLHKDLPERLSWGIMPFLWEVAKLPRHPTWRFPLPKLPYEWHE